mgnify:CR=1 FL=1
MESDRCQLPPETTREGAFSDPTAPKLTPLRRYAYPPLPHYDDIQAVKFLDIALNQALFGNIAGDSVTGGLFKLLGFANGGRPPVGKPSIVGEKGPELFVPRSSGTIVPNNKLGGGGSTNIVVNVDASGTDVQGDDAQAKELGTLVSVAVKGELLKQQRPGGLLSSLR